MLYRRPGTASRESAHHGEADTEIPPMSFDGLTPEFRQVRNGTRGKCREVPEIFPPEINRTFQNPATQSRRRDRKNRQGGMAVVPRGLRNHTPQSPESSAPLPLPEYRNVENRKVFDRPINIPINKPETRKIYVFLQILVNKPLTLRLWHTII